jgi:Zn-dependent protease with chaperone function
MRQRLYRTTAYRYPREQLILGLTLMLVFLVIIVTATATLCLSFVFVLLFVAAAYAMTNSRHSSLLQEAHKVTPASAQALNELVQESTARLQPGPVDVFVVPSRKLNAYTFGLSSPKAVVLHSALLEAMDRDELSFVIGHELGHVSLGHTWLNSVVGGLAGIPSPALAFVILSMAFLWWNRACEHSADRAGLLACGSLQKATSTLVKLAAGENARSRQGLERALQRIEAEDDDLTGTLGEMMGTHPMTIRRIEQLQRFAATAEYRRIRERMDQNLSLGGER